MNENLKFALSLFVCFTILLATLFGTVAFFGQQLGVSGNKTVTGVFIRIEYDKSDATIFFQDYSIIKFYQPSELGSMSLQVPLVVGHTYQFIFAVHNTGGYLTLQSVVEIP